MNPNSANQRWSRWTFLVIPSKTGRISFADVKANCARFFRKGFGSATQMKVEEKLKATAGDTNSVTNQWLIDIRTEGAPAHDPAYRAYMVSSIEKFLRLGFGADSTITHDVKIEAGSSEDGKPAAQLIILPPISIAEG